MSFSPFGLIFAWYYHCIFAVFGIVCVCCYFCQAEAPCIGFSNLPEQLHRKAIKKGFDFTVMVVGMCNVSFICLELSCSSLSCVCLARNGIFLPFCTLAILWPPCKILCRSNNVCVPYSGGWNFWQYFFAILCLSHPLTSMQNFAEIVPGELLHWGTKHEG